MKCTSAIGINGTNYQCKHNIGDEHFGNKHEADVTNAGDPDGGMIVYWSLWRRVKPTASGGSVDADGISGSVLICPEPTPSLPTRRFRRISYWLFLFICLAYPVANKVFLQMWEPDISMKRLPDVMESEPPYRVNWVRAHYKFGPLLRFGNGVPSIGGDDGSASLDRLPSNDEECDNSDDNERPLGGFIASWRFYLACLCFVSYPIILICGKGSIKSLIIGAMIVVIGALLAFGPWGKVNTRGQHYCDDEQPNLTAPEPVEKKGT